jgi:hypothetical protein
MLSGNVYFVTLGKHVYIGVGFLFCIYCGGVIDGMGVMVVVEVMVLVVISDMFNVLVIFGVINDFNY